VRTCSPRTTLRGIAAFAKEKQKDVPSRQAAPSVNCSLANRA